MLIDIPDELIARLKALANSEIAADNEDFEVYAWAGGNIDDAYSMGESTGEVDLAREIWFKYLQPVVEP